MARKTIEEPQDLRGEIARLRRQTAWYSTREAADKVSLLESLERKHAGRRGAATEGAAAPASADSFDKP